MQCILERYYKQLRASGNGAAGKAMAIPGFEGEKYGVPNYAGQLHEETTPPKSFYQPSG